jgi:hypothetical protein
MCSLNFGAGGFAVKFTANMVERLKKGPKDCIGWCEQLFIYNSSSIIGIQEFMAPSPSSFKDPPL